MGSISAYIAMDRSQALAQGEVLPDRSSGAVLFADISGYTSLTQAFMAKLGPKLGAELLTRQINHIFDLLITEVHHYRGSIIGFGGDGITCWFDGDDGQRGTACGLNMQQAMKQFAQLDILPDLSVSVAIKVVVVVGPIRRFQIGDPKIQLLDVMAGATLEYMAAAEKKAAKGEILVGAEIVAALRNRIEVVEWRSDDQNRKFAVISALAGPVEVIPWPVLDRSIAETEIRPRLLLPVYESLKTGRDRFLGEFRRPVALFLKFSGIAYDQDDAAEEKLNAYIRLVQNVLDQYGGYLIKLMIGDKGSYLLATFGVPLAHDEEIVKAMAAALDLQSPAMRPPFIAGVQIGLTQGWMLTGIFGGPARRVYDVLGDAANLSARLMDKARPGQILVSQSLAQTTGRYFRFNYLGQIELKGSAEPLPVSELVGRATPSAQRPASLFTTPLAGRQQELVELEQALESIVAGQGQIWRLEGEAGLGKSHLAAEFIERARARGLRVVVGVCQSTRQHIPYTPWRQALSALLGLGDEPLDRSVHETQSFILHLTEIIGQLNPDWLIRLPLLGELFNLRMDDNDITASFTAELRRNTLFSLVIDLVKTWAQRQPLLLFIEDTHWLDETSQSLLLALSRTLADSSVLLLITQRPLNDKAWSELSQLANYHSLLLDRLSPEDVMALTTHCLAGQPAPLLASVLEAWTDGNPFFVGELLTAVRESEGLHLTDDREWTLAEPILLKLQQAKCLVRLEDQWQLASDASLAGVDLGLPDKIHQLVQVRLDKLTREQQMTMRVAGAIGPVFEFELLAKAHPFEPDPAALREQLNLLEAHDFIRLESTSPQLIYMFRHHLTQEVAYQTMLIEQQRDLHHRVGQALAELRPDAVEQLAYHYYRALDLTAKVVDRQSGVWAKAALCLGQAARKTQREYANEAALNYYLQALSLEERWEWRQGQIEVLHLLGKREEEKAGLERLEASLSKRAGKQRIDDPLYSGPSLSSLTFAAAYLWGQYYEAIGDFPQAQTAVERALGASREMTDPAKEARCLAQLGLIARRRGDYDVAKNWYGQAVTLCQMQAANQAEVGQVFIETLMGLGTVYRQQGLYDQAQARFQQTLELSRQSGDKRGEADAFNHLGVTTFYQRNFTQALSYHQQALTIRRSIGDRTGEGISLMNLAQTSRDAGDYSQVERYLTAALAIQQAVANRWEEVNIWNDLGGLYYELGDLATAQACLEHGLRLSREIGDEAGQAYLLCNLGLVLQAKGELARAERILTEGIRLAQTYSELYLASSCFEYLSLVYLDEGRWQAAIEQAKASLALRLDLDPSHPRITDDLATLARATLALGNVDEALDYARQILTNLETYGSEGPEFPQRAYFFGYQVLATAGQAKQAQAALQAAYDVVMTRAAKISDPAQRSSFLEQRAMNREVVEEWERRRGEET